MAKMEQILNIKPAVELNFFGPFNQQVSSVMHLSNPSDKKVCFKIKTTAPKRYCVKPNSGVIDPDETVKISVSLQPFDFDPQEKSKHKFMVQSMYAPEGEINQDNLWKEADSSQLMDSKLRCVFVMPDAKDAGTNVSFKMQQPLMTSAVAGSAPGATAADGPLMGNSADNNEHMMASNNLDSKPHFSQGDMAGDGGGDENLLRRSTEEIRKLQEELSALRQENIQLKEESLRQQRLATSRIGADAGSQSHSSSRQGLKVSAMNPDATALSPYYLYSALAILVLGVIIGKWIF